METINNLSDTMNDLTKNFSLVTFVLLCLIVYAITVTVRWSVEGMTELFASTKGFKHSAAWRGWLLKILPIVTGGTLAGFAKSFPFPVVVLESTSGRIGLGLVAGLLSSLIYRESKKRIKTIMQSSNESSK